jgi:hypothetical protein
VLTNQPSGETTSEIPPASDSLSELGNTILKNTQANSSIAVLTKRSSIHHHIAQHTNRVRDTEKVPVMNISTWI